MNRRLFWKIFLPFWVAQAVLLGALYLRLHYRISSEHPWWIQTERREMPVLADLAAQASSSRDRLVLPRCWTKCRCPTVPASGWLMRPGHELSGHEIPQRVLDDASKAEQNEGLHHSYEANVLAAAATTSRGRYTVDLRTGAAPAQRARSRRHPLDLEVRHHLLGHRLFAHRALSDQAHRTAAQRDPSARAWKP